MACLLFQKLMECAKAIEGGNLDVADSLLESIQSLASQGDSESMRKVFHARLLSFLTSTWKFTDPPQSSSGLCVMHDRVDDSKEMASSSESEDDEENDPCIMVDRNLWSTQGSTMNQIAASAKLFDILEYLFMLSIHDFVGGHAHHCLEEGQGVAGKALQSNIHFQRVWRNRILRACFAIRLTSTHSCKDDYVLEVYLPESMEETSERELLVSEVLRTLQENCLESWKVWVGELNEASGFRVGLDDERMSNIPHEAVSSILQLPSSDGVLGRNEFMTFNTTSNQAGETHEPLEQDNSLESWKV
ncbi:hypothetical protein OIU78_018049 [Salix suchowensis]|nr:hypothetical protein OIU78_018049 [Salix suchowensis]